MHAAFRACGPTNVAVTLLPEEDTHLSLYEGGAGQVASYMAFGLSMVTFLYVALVLVKASKTLVSSAMF